MAAIQKAINHHTFCATIFLPMAGDPIWTKVMQKIYLSLDPPPSPDSEDMNLWKCLQLQLHSDLHWQPIEEVCLRIRQIVQRILPLPPCQDSGHCQPHNQALLIFQ
jgi:hypothetical protein